MSVIKYYLKKDEKNFNRLKDEEKNDIIKKLLNNLKNKAFIEKKIAEEPYLLAHIISMVDETTGIRLIDIATRHGANFYDLIDRNPKISNNIIVNIACRNQPDLVLELDDRPELQDYISMETIIDAFCKNPEVLSSKCKALQIRVKLEGKKANGEKAIRYAKLITQFKRAINLFCRPEAYKGNEFDQFAKEIADQIDSKSFVERLSNNKMLTRYITVANETLKTNPSKGKYLPAKTLHLGNNRVLYVLPNLARRDFKHSKANFNYWKKQIKGELCNASLNSFTEDEKTRFVKRCMKLVPALYFELLDIKEVDYSEVAKKRTVLVSTYDAFKHYHDTKNALKFLSALSDEDFKFVLARSKANSTRKSNKKSNVRKHVKVEEKTEETEETLSLKK